MNWFERLTGFKEAGYEKVQSKLEVEDQILFSPTNGRRFQIGLLELVSLQELRKRVSAQDTQFGQLRLDLIQGDAGTLHREPQYKGALFQVASQFNLLEMISPHVKPEQGVAGYEYDRTQGPACAIAAGAATIYRNYFVPVEGHAGQRENRQLDGLADMGTALSTALVKPVSSLWQMVNGYALCTRAGLEWINAYLATLSPAEKDTLRSTLRIGVHWDVEVTDVDHGTGPLVSQALCSALPVAYSRIEKALWGPFASLVLEATYEATLLAGVLNARRGASNKVLLTLVGGGAFGNDRDWILQALSRALNMTRGYDLEVYVVSYGHISEDLYALSNRFENIV